MSNQSQPRSSRVLPYNGFINEQLPIEQDFGGDSVDLVQAQDRFAAWVNRCTRDRALSQWSDDL